VKGKVKKELKKGWEETEGHPHPYSGDWEAVLRVDGRKKSHIHLLLL
jgi:hypothetical protein